MKCLRCGRPILPSVGCTKCGKVSDEVLARIARETLPARTGLRIQGVVFVAAALVLGVGVLVAGVLIGSKIILAGIVVSPAVGAFGAKCLEQATLGNYLDEYLVERYEKERTQALAASAGGKGSIAIPALRATGAGPGNEQSS